jgi:hypothetical protein
MASVPPLLSFLLMIAAGWVHRHQLIVIEFQKLERYRWHYGARALGNTP